MNTRRLWKWGGGYPFAIGAVAAVALACLPLWDRFSVQTLMLLFVPAVAVVARLAGTRPSAFAAVLSVLVLDVLFTEPYYQLTISNPSEWIALGVFLVIALIIGGQTGNLARREQAAVRRQRELALLNRLSFHVVSDTSVATAAELIASQVATVLGARRAAVYTRSGREGAELLAFAGEAPSEDESEFARWVIKASKAIGLPPSLGAAVEPRPVSVGTKDALPGKVADGVYLPLQTTAGLEGVLYAHACFDDENSEEDARFIVAVANLAGAALERRRVESEATALTLEREADQLKSTIISSVSHELKTPLSAATARITGLLDEGEGCDAERVRDELQAISSDLSRLNAAIVDLVDVSRLESDAWRPQPELYEVSEILGSVLAKFADEPRDRIEFDLPDPTPFVYVDFSQTVRALANIVDNALVYSPQTAKVRVSVSESADVVRMSIEDNGPGVPEAEKLRVFEKFYRGGAATAVPGGTGLGLAIALDIVESQEGSITIEDAEPNGARFVVSLPVAVIGAEAE